MMPTNSHVWIFNDNAYGELFIINKYFSTSRASSSSKLKIKRQCKIKRIMLITILHLVFSSIVAQVLLFNNEVLRSGIFRLVVATFGKSKRITN